jgi:uncharacterized protein
MKIIIPGGTGQVGTVLARAFHTDGYEVVILTRKPQPARWKTVLWDGKTLGPWTSDLEDADVLINLTGRTVNCRYHQKNRREILESRVDSVHVIAKAIAQLKNPPRAWLPFIFRKLYKPLARHRYLLGAM